MTKLIPEGRYMVGIFTARVFDTMSQKPRQLDSFAIPLRPDRMIREISYTKKNDGYDTEEEIIPLLRFSTQSISGSILSYEFVCSI